MPTTREDGILEFEWRHRSDDELQHVAHWFVSVLPEHPLRLVVCTLRTNCGGSFDPESRKVALCRRESLCVGRPVAVCVVHLHPVVHDEGRRQSRMGRRNPVLGSQRRRWSEDVITDGEDHERGPHCGDIFSFHVEDVFICVVRSKKMSCVL